MIETENQSNEAIAPAATGRSPIGSSGRKSFRSLWLQSFGIALLACTLSLLRFSPPFEKWMAYDHMMGRVLPEIHRARTVEKQLNDPWGFTPGPSDRVITWRLLPVMPAHYLELPFKALLVFGWTGVLVLVWYCGSRLPVTSLWWERLGLAILVATSSVFFVSTGWLAYFDAWWVFCLCLVVFSPSTIVVVIALALAPWIDERFLLGLPAAFAARVLVKNLSVRECATVLGWLALGVAPYAILRLAFWGGSLNHEPTEYLSERSLSVMWRNPLGYGTWEGLRAGWLLVPCLVPFVARGREFRVAFLATASAVSLGAAFYVADDLSRSAGILLPGVVGMVVVAQAGAGRTFRWALLAAAALNLALPASHVIARTHGNIPTFPEVMSRMQTWQEDILVNGANAFAVTQMKSGEFETAFWLLLDANKQDPRNVPVLHNLARAADLSGHEVRAAWAYRRLIQENPSEPGPMLYLALLCEKQGDATDARSWAKQALAHASPDWPKAEEAKQLLDRLGTDPNETPGPEGDK